MLPESPVALQQGSIVAGQGFSFPPHEGSESRLLDYRQAGLHAPLRSGILVLHQRSKIFAPNAG
jgi:hypothetical protein